MTTIAYRDGVLAADSLVCGDNTRWGAKTKIVRARCGIMGGASGDASAAAHYLEWVESLEKEPQPEAAPDTTHGVDGLLISRDGSVWCWTGGMSLFRMELPEGETFTAIGSGAKLAMGAMAMGASAERAVEIAIKYDIYTGGRITTLALSAPRPTRRRR